MDAKPLISLSLTLVAETNLPDTGAPTRSVSDEELVQRVQRSDPLALETLYARYSRPAISLAYRITGRMDMAEDVAQEVFLKLWERPYMFEPERGRFVAWLLRVVHNQALNAVRHRTRHPAISTTDGDDTVHEILANLPDDAPVPEDVVWLNEQRDAIRTALAQLADPQRIAIELAYFRGMQQNEIATSLDLPLGTIKTRIRLGLQKMRRLLDTQDTLA